MTESEAFAKWQDDDANGGISSHAAWMERAARDRSEELAILVLNYHNARFNGQILKSFALGKKTKKLAESILKDAA